MNPQIASALEKLREYGRTHIKLGKDMLPLDRGIYKVDFLATATLNRSVQLLAGFCALMEARNFIAAAPLLRLQLDNCLRFYASTLVPDANAFVMQVMKGERISRMRDREGKPLTDHNLVQHLAKYCSWVPSVYEHTSGYVHLSDKHIFSAMQHVGGETFSFKISEADEYVPDEIYLEAIEAFKQTTDILFMLIKDWVDGKRAHGIEYKPHHAPGEPKTI